MKRCGSPELFREILLNGGKGIKKTDIGEQEIAGILDFAEDNEIDPLIIEGIERRPGIIRILSPETLNRIRVMKRNAVFKSLLFRRELQKIASAIPRNLAGKPMLLKGAALAGTVYPAGYPRRMNDIDILAGADFFADLKEVLLKNGYAGRPIGAKRPYTEKIFYEERFIKSAGCPDEVILELHKSLCEPTRFDIPVGELFERSVRHPEFDGIFSILSPEDMYIHLCVHLAQKLFDENLKHLYDIFVFIERGLADFKTVLGRAGIYGVETITRISSRLAVNAFRPGNSARYPFSGAPGDIAGILKERYIESFFDPENLKLYRFEHHLRLRQALLMPAIFDDLTDFAGFALHYGKTRIIDLISLH
ncbi:MAG: nucleotidyltransferase family protein [Deltaproteobacteria bacterium]|nr:nucleotidyltransferase family protein [Deltaproteobacteria bacterium]